MNNWQLFISGTIKDHLTEEQADSLIELVDQHAGVISCSTPDNAANNPSFSVTFSVDSNYPEYAGTIGVNLFRKWSKEIDVESTIVHVEIMIEE